MKTHNNNDDDDDDDIFHDDVAFPIRNRTKGLIITRHTGHSSRPADRCQWFRDRRSRSYTIDGRQRWRSSV